jgi:hypothetical protein
LLTCICCVSFVAPPHPLVNTGIWGGSKVGSDIIAIRKSE